MCELVFTTFESRSDCWSYADLRVIFEVFHLVLKSSFLQQTASVSSFYATLSPLSFFVEFCWLAGILATMKLIKMLKLS